LDINEDESLGVMLVESIPTGDLGYEKDDDVAAGEVETSSGRTAGEVETRVAEVGLGKEVGDIQNVRAILDLVETVRAKVVA